MTINRRISRLLGAGMVTLLAVPDQSAARPVLKDDTPGSCAKWRTALQAKPSRIADQETIASADAVLRRGTKDVATADFVPERRTLIIASDGRIAAIVCN